MSKSLPPGRYGSSRWLRLEPDDFAHETKVAACVQWYSQGLLSQSKASEISGLSRAAFLAELSRRKIPISQVDEDELAEELEHLREARR